MNRLKLEKHRRIEDNIIKDLKNIFKLKKEIDDNIIKDTRNLLDKKRK